MSLAHDVREMPLAASDEDQVEEDLRAIDAVIYADLFDCAVNREMVCEFALGKRSKAELCVTVERLARQGVLEVDGDGVCLSGRSQVLRHLHRRLTRAETLRRKGQWWSRVLGHVPFVRGIGLTGSVAAGVAPASADVDLLVIVSEERLATVWLVLGSFASLTRRRFFCPNYYVSESALPIDRRSHFVAREIVQTVPLWGRAAALATHNQWAYQRFPNVRFSRVADQAEPGPLLQRLLERVLGGALGVWVEERARSLAWRRVRHHYRRGRGEVPADVERQWSDGEALRFHGGRKMVGIMQRYEARRAEVRARLERARSAQGGATHG